MTSPLSEAKTMMATFLSPLATLAVQLSALLAALLLFGIFLAVVGAPPIAVFEDMLLGAFGSWFSLQNSLARAAPLMLTALCTALPARLGLVIIGNEGALLMGGLAAAALGGFLSAETSGIMALGSMLLLGALAGGAWIALAGILRQRRGINETISSLLLFYIGLSIFLYLVEGPLRDPASLNKPSTLPLQEAHMLPLIPGTDVHYGLLFGVLSCLFAYVLMEHTSFGFGARVVGGNLRTARLIGLPVTRLFVVTCALGGAAAGLAGAVEVSAIHGAANATLYARVGFAGILVAFLARQHPLAIIPAALLLGGIQASGGVLQRRHELPDAVVEVFKGTLFVVILFSESYVGRARSWAERVAANMAAKTADSAAASAASASKVNVVEARSAAREQNAEGAP